MQRLNSFLLGQFVKNPIAWVLLAILVYWFYLIQDRASQLRAVCQTFYSAPLVETYYAKPKSNRELAINACINARGGP